MRLFIVAAGVAAALFMTPQIHRDVPSIVADIPRDQLDSTTWSARLAERFPIGTEAASLERALIQQGFNVRSSEPGSTHARMASYAAESSDCITWLTASWNVDRNGELEDLQGRIGGACS